MGGCCLTMLEPTCCSNPVPCWEDVEETDGRLEPRMLFMLELTKYGTLLLVTGIPPPYRENESFFRRFYHLPRKILRPWITYQGLRYNVSYVQCSTKRSALFFSKFQKGGGKESIDDQLP